MDEQKLCRLDAVCEHVRSLLQIHPDLQSAFSTREAGNDRAARVVYERLVAERTKLLHDLANEEAANV